VLRIVLYGNNSALALHGSTRLALGRKEKEKVVRQERGTEVSYRGGQISPLRSSMASFFFSFSHNLFGPSGPVLDGLDQPFRVTRSSTFARRFNGSRISTDRRRRGNAFLF
jgi:hypothetical protein